MLSLLLNILWFVFGGFAAGLGWMVGAALLAVTIVGLPWVPAVFRIGVMAFAPFGRHAAPREILGGQGADGGGCLVAALNVIWFLLAGWWIAMAHAIIGLLQGLTVIGIPFAVQHFKLAALALAPVGKTLRS